MDLTGLFEQFDMDKLRESMEGVEKEQKNIRIKKEVGGGLVTVEVTGAQRVVDVKIDESLLVKEEKQTLEDLLVAGINSALEGIKEKVKEIVMEKSMNLFSST